MFSVGSDSEVELPSSNMCYKRVKFPKKNSDETSAVAPAAVPRKLRSAIKKRGRESTFPPSGAVKNINYVANKVQSLRQIDVKPKAETKHGGSVGQEEEVIDGSMSKDEEEVAETLYAMAGMFPDATKRDDTNINSKSPESHDAVAEVDGSDDELGVQKEELQTKRSSGLAFKEENKFQSIAGPTSIIQPDSEKMSGLEGVISCEKRPEISTDLVCSAGTKNELYHYIKQKTDCETGSSPRPGLFSTELGDPAILATSLRSQTTQLPAWFEKTDPKTKQSEVFEVTNKEVQHAVNSERRKRCSTHVNICHMIKDLQRARRKEGLLMEHSLSCEGSKQDVHPTANQKMESVEKIDSFAAAKNQFEVRNAILLHQGLLKDEQNPCTSFRLSTLRELAVHRVLDTGGNLSRLENSMETLHHVSYLHSQSQTIMPLSLGQNSSPSTSSPYSAYAAQQVTLPPGLGGAFCSPLLPQVAFLPQRKQQQQIQLQTWGTLRNTQLSSSGICGSYLPERQTGRPESLTASLQAQSSLSSQTLMETSCSKYPEISQHPQHFLAIPSAFPSCIKNQQHHHLPPVFHGSGRGIHSSSVTPLQLLCNENI